MVDRETKKVFLPAKYGGRCKTGNYSSYWPGINSMGSGDDKVSLSKNATLYRFEFRMPVIAVDDPPADEESKDAFNLSIADFMAAGASNIFYGRDKDLKGILTKNISHPDKAIDITAERHLEAQKSLDDWRFELKVGKGKTTKVTSVVAQLVGAGVLDESNAEGIETNEDLQKALAQLNA